MLAVSLLRSGFTQASHLRAGRILTVLQARDQPKLLSTFKSTILEYFKGHPHYATLLRRNDRFPVSAGSVAHGDLKYGRDISCLDQEQVVLMSFEAIADKHNPRSYCILKDIYSHFKSNINTFEQLSLMEVSILCNSFFIGNVTVSAKPVLRRISQLAITELETSGVTVSLLPLLKVLRKADFRTDSLMDVIALSLSKGQAAQYNMAQLSHALAVLADGRFFNPKLTDRISSNVRLVLEKTKPASATKKFIHPEKGARAKDLTRLIWALSCLKVRPSFFSSVAATVVEEAEQRWDSGQFSSDPHLISDLLLSLACSKIYPIEFINKVVNGEFIKAISSQNKSNRASRFALFASCARLELPWEHLPPLLRKPLDFNVELPETMEKQLKKRRLLSQVLTLLHTRASSLGWTDFSCCCPIPYLNLCGITFETNGKKIAVEVLDSLVCMRHTNTPDRLMTLKIRLMQQRGYHVIQIPPLQRNTQNGHLLDDDFWSMMAKNT